MICGVRLSRVVRSSEHNSGRPERFFGQIVGIARSTLRYNFREKNEYEMRLALIRVAKQYARYGYRKVGQLLRNEGWCVNHKKVQRIWREAGYSFPNASSAANGFTTMMPQSSASGPIPQTTFGRSNLCMTS